MTFKEKVAEVEPENIDDDVLGGVIGCPEHYEYLNTNDPKFVCPIDIKSDCTACWNREYKEDNHAV